jgi:hypothetical protein
MEESTVEIGLTQSPENTSGGIRYLEEVSIPCRLVTPSREPSYMIMNVELSAVKVSVSNTV